MSMAAFLLVLCGCAATLDPAKAPTALPVEAASDSNPSADSAGAPIAIVKEVDISALPKEPSQCEDLTRPGSRIVVARRCRSIDEEALADQLNQVRREQETLDRLARERESRRGGL
jgi:hypothetical protein